MKNMSEESIRKIIIITSIIILSATIFTISYIVTSNNNKEEYFAEVNTNTESQTASSSVGKNVEESERSTNKIVNETMMTNKEENNEKINNRETKATISQVNEETKNVDKNNEKKSEKEQDNVNNRGEGNKESEKGNTPSFVAPVEGEILKEFSMDSLVYSETLKEWTTHSGLDIRAEKTTIVKAAADGRVKSIKNDPRYGLTVVIEHDENYQTVYANLLTTEFVKEGEEVKQGQSIGTVGNTATFEISDPSHLHFEILKDGIAVNPGLYL